MQTNELIMQTNEIQIKDSSLVAFSFYIQPLGVTFEEYLKMMKESNNRQAKAKKRFDRLRVIYLIGIEICHNFPRSCVEEYLSLQNKKYSSICDSQNYSKRIVDDGCMKFFRENEVIDIISNSLTRYLGIKLNGSLYRVGSSLLDYLRANVVIKLGDKYSDVAKCVMHCVKGGVAVGINLIREVERSKLPKEKKKELLTIINDKFPAAGDNDCQVYVTKPAKASSLIKFINDDLLPAYDLGTMNYLRKFKFNNKIEKFCKSFRVKGEEFDKCFTGYTFEFNYVRSKLLDKTKNCPPTCRNKNKETNNSSYSYPTRQVCALHSFTDETFPMFVNYKNITTNSSRCSRHFYMRFLMRIHRSNSTSERPLLTINVKVPILDLCIPFTGDSCYVRNPNLSRITMEPKDFYRNF
jgi:hypothetical protein